MYNVDYFIIKFEAIPEGKWGEVDLLKNNKRCAYGLCGMINYCLPTLEAKALGVIFKNLILSGFNTVLCDFVYVEGNVIHINDGNTNEYRQPTPKQRILAALYDIKAAKAVEEAQQIINTEPVNHDTPIIRYAL